MRMLLVLLLPLWLVPGVAQTDIEIETDSVGDSIAIDTLKADSVSLPWPQSIAYHIDRLLQDDMFQTSQVGIMVYDLTADSAIYCHNERQLMRPASTLKTITAITALDRLGGSYQFKTDLCYTGGIVDGVLKGDIYVNGGFDPRFNVDDMRAFVESLHKMGVDTIRGTLYADRSMKDDKLLGEGWCWDDDNPVLSPLVFARKDEFMSRFRRELQEAGIYVDAFTSTGRKPAEAKCIITRFHTIDMFYQIAASTGERPASASDARRVVNRLIEKVGLDPKRYQIADGSGLSLYNYVSAQLEVRLLTYAWKNQNIYLHLYPSLPIAGVDGTLRNRMRGSFTNGNVHAKTGTVTGISSLCGYCRAANGHELCFSIINQGVMNGRNGRRFQDRVCTILCQP